MKSFRFILMFLVFLFPISAISDDDPPPPPARISVFSTSTDWESVTGLRLHIYDLKFIRDSKLIANGLELYYFDSFPCYGQTDRTRIWFGRNNASDNAVSIVCLYAPEKILFGWRNAGRNALQDKTVGVLECPVKDSGKLEIDLSKCVKGKDWTEYR